MEKPCPKQNQIRNPKPPHRCITIDGATYKKLVKEGLISVSSQQPMTQPVVVVQPDLNIPDKPVVVVQPDLNITDKPCPKPNQIRNPKPPHRCITIGGATYKKLVKEGLISVSSQQPMTQTSVVQPSVVQPSVVQPSVVQPMAQTVVVVPSTNVMKKPCPKPNQIRNPKPPHRCIKIGGATYLKLVREGELKVELEHKNFLSEQTYNLLKANDSDKYEKSPSQYWTPKKANDSGKDEKSPSPSPKKVIYSGKDEKSPSPSPKTRITDKDDIKLHSDIELLLENTELSAYDTVDEQKSILRCLGLLSA